MTAFHHHGSGHDPHGEMSFIRKAISNLVTLVVVVVTVGFSLTLLAAATGNLDMVKRLFGL